MQNPNEDYMQFQVGGPRSQNMKETKSSNHLWINRSLDHHQNHEALVKSFPKICDMPPERKYIKAIPDF